MTPCDFIDESLFYQLRLNNIFLQLGSERWGRPHFSSLSLHSLINLKVSLEKAIIILDYDKAKDFTNIAFKISEMVANKGLLSDGHSKEDLLRLLLIRHKFVDSVVARGGQTRKRDGFKRLFGKGSATVSKSFDMKIYL